MININRMIAPSLMAHIFGVFILLFAFFILISNFKEITSKPFNTIVVLLLFSASVTLHGLSHLGLEYVYGFNPLKI